MRKEVFLEYKGKEAIITQYPNFSLTGVIEEVFEDCIRFRTPQKTSYIDFRAIVGVRGA